LNGCLFGTLKEAIEKIEAWRIDYNTTRPHSSIDNQTPAAFAAASVLAIARSQSDRTG
jgi:putative transposase